jgi:hypothetical protein
MKIVTPIIFVKSRDTIHEDQVGLFMDRATSLRDGTTSQRVS